jgi:cation diffusion facilitator CzcD-associated flavoprotein CzcO
MTEACDPDMMRAMRERVCIIGAGPCGITAAKAVLDAERFEVVVYERGAEVGGNWVFAAESGHSSVFETTHIISSKRFSQYEDFPMPDDFPDYPGHRHLATYFQGYAKTFSLYPHIRFHTTVEHCTPLADDRWRVRVVDERGSREEEFDWLLVANGHHSQPRMPCYPGQFTGQLLHSHDFKRAEPFRDRRVLVIGGGNSACDVAVEVARVAARVDLSWRRGYWIVPKFVFGVPSDHVHNALHGTLGFLPWSWRARIHEAALRVLNGPNAAYGLPEPDHRFGATHPTLNSELLYFIRHGEIHPRPDLAGYDGREVVFTDRERQAYDAIIACTGYVISHPFFDPRVVDFSSGAVPLYLKMLHAEHRRLIFIGLFQPLGCIWPAAELQAKLAVRLMCGDWTPPQDLAAAIAGELAHPDVPQLETPRHTITVDYPAFRRRLLVALGREAA